MIGGRRRGGKGRLGRRNLRRRKKNRVGWKKKNNRRRKNWKRRRLEGVLGDIDMGMIQTNTRTINRQTDGGGKQGHIGRQRGRGRGSKRGEIVYHSEGGRKGTMWWYVMATIWHFDYMLFLICRMNAKMIAMIM